MGSTSINTAIAAANEGIPTERSPKYFASKITALIKAALSTEGVGRTRNINRNNMRPTINKRFLSFLITNWRNQNRKVATSAKFAPLTAVKCDNPTRRICSVNSGDCKEVSPKTNPGIKAPA